jgi:glycosyltransferase involved in cell wall biosynthesis
VVSILIPARNAGPWIRETLESALAQTWPRTEIIVADDDSTDDTAAIVDGLAARGVRRVRSARRGAAAARNTAFAQARGDWIQFLDADDLLAPDKLARQLAGAPPAECALAGDWSRFVRTIADADFPPERLCRDARPVDWLVDKLAHHAMMHPAAWLIARPLAVRAGRWDETLSLDDDGEYFSRVVLASAGVRHCPGARSYYRSRQPGTLSQSRSARAWDSAFRSLESTADRLRAVEDSPRTRAACATAYQRFIYEAYPWAPARRRAAAARVAALGGSTLAPAGGPKFQWAARLLGWRLATRLRRLGRPGRSR